jgi:RimJ/RimL family protein N-acetyltransferase
MTAVPTLTTPRIRLRPWREQDLPAFAAMNADPHVMEHLPKLLERAESDAMAGWIVEHFAKHGFGWWAVEVIGVAKFAGFTGLSRATFPAHFTPTVEISWRLAHPCWGKGYATEAARRVVAFAFDELALDEIVSFTVPANCRSIRVMERIGMTRLLADDFDHPRLPNGHPLRRHVLYRLSRSHWETLPPHSPGLALQPAGSGSR